MEIQKHSNMKFLVKIRFKLHLNDCTPFDLKPENLKRNLHTRLYEDLILDQKELDQKGYNP